MSDVSVSERRIKPIQDAVDSENWKQALQICEKWQKKGEKSDRFQAIKAFVLVKQPDASTHRRGVEETIQLCRRTPAITDLDALHQIQDTLKDLSLEGDETTTLWDRAVATKPEDKELATTWLHRSVADNNWLGAQKAAMALRKAFPKDRNYDYWNILMCYLIHTDSSRSEKETTIFGTLAYRMISKAVEGVPMDKTQLLSSGKALQTPEELYLLVKIFLSTAHADEAVKLLQSDNLGVKSQFADRDPQLVRALLLEAFQAAGAWQEAFVYCCDLLRQDQQQDEKTGARPDGKVWSLLVQAAKVSNDPQLQEEAKAIVEDTLKVQDGLRDVHQALLSLAQAQGNSTELLQACENYWHKFRRKPFCFEDLKDPITALDQSHQQSLLGTLSKDVSGASDIAESSSADYVPALNLLKLRYCFSLSSGASKEQLKLFACEALALYQNSAKTTFPCPEAALVGAIALVRLAFEVQSGSSSKSRPDQFLLQAIFVLEACRSISKDYYPYSLLLLHLKSLLGLMSLVMKDFQGLNIKNVQWETTGHLLLTRISTTHPHVAGGSASLANVRIEPLRALHAALTMSDNAGDSLSAQIRSGLKNGSYANVIDSVAMRADFENSLSKRIFAQEAIRISRLLSLPGEDEVPPRPFQLVDNRDFAYLPTYEASESTDVWQYLRPGPVPREQWLNATTFHSATTRFMKGEIYGHHAPVAGELELLQTVFAAAKDIAAAGSQELTSVESDNLKIHLLLAHAAMSTQEPVPSEAPSPNEAIADIERWLQSKLADAEEAQNNDLLHLDAQIQAPSWYFLHHSYSILETLQGIALLLAVLGKKPKTSRSKPPAVQKDRLTSIQELTAQVETRIHDSARKLKAGINMPGILGKLLDHGMARNERDDMGPVGKVLEQLSDEAAMETFSGDMRDSWDDALDGILAVKVKVPK